MMTEFDFFTDRADRWTKNFSTLWGNIDICPHLNRLELLCHSPVEFILLAASRYGGIFKALVVTWPIYWSAWVTLQKKGSMVCLWFGWIPPRLGPLPWRRQLRNWLPAPPVELTGLMSWHSCMRVLVTCHSPRVNTWASCLKERQREPPVGGSAN